MFKAILQLLNLFRKSDNNLLQKSSVEPGAERNYILITFDKTNKYEPYIKLNITDLSQEACDAYAETLYDLHSGRYYQSFINLLLNMSKQDNKIYKFVESAIVYWGYLIKKTSVDLDSHPNVFSHSAVGRGEQNNNKPLVAPTDFNKHADR
jgi:hypothetical protein